MANKAKATSLISFLFFFVPFSNFASTEVISSPSKVTTLNNSSVARGPTAPTSTPSAAAVDMLCQQNMVLNALLIRALMTKMHTTTQNPIADTFQRLFNINPNKNENLDDFQKNLHQTKIMTTTFVTTVTELTSTIFNIIRNNKKVPTTIFSSSLVELTEIKTLTSTMPLEPTAQLRLRRDDHQDVNEMLVSSLDDVQHMHKTPQLRSIPSNAKDASGIETEDHELRDLFNNPEVQDAWADFLRVVQQANDAPKK